MTTTFPQTIQETLEQADPNTLADALRRIVLARMLTVVKVTVTGLTAAAAVDITAAATKAAATIVGVSLAAAENLPAIGQVVALRVVAGAATAGARIVTDAGGTAGAPGANGPGVALLSDDGRTVTFEGDVTGFVIEYVPRAAVPLTDLFPDNI